MAANSYVGTPVPRNEDLRLLRGRGQFVGDLSCPGMLHAAFLRSPLAHGRIHVVETGTARALPGVRAVLTAAEIGLPVPTIALRLLSLPELQVYEQPVVAHDKVRFVGEPIAIAVADSPAAAEDAVEAIRLDIEPLPVVADRDAAARDQILLFESSGTNRAATYTARHGDQRAAENAARVRRETFRVHRHTAVPMEPRGLLAVWDTATGRLSVSGAAKNPFVARGILASLLGLAEDAIDMLEFDVGGGFGVRGDFCPEDFLVPFAARHLGRPVKWIEDRREHLLSANHARDMECELELACHSDGRILALRGRIRVDVGAYLRSSAAIGPRNAAQFLPGPYRIPSVEVEAALLMTNKTPTGVYRGPGRFEADFFRERLFDMMAADLGLDPVEFRRRNLVTAAEMPYPVATLSPNPKHDELDSGDYASTLDRCLEELGWREKRALQGRLIDSRHHGIGVGCFIEGTAEGPKETARLVVEPDGGIVVYVGSAGLGQGLETVCAQIAADALELPLERIRVLHGSTTYLREGYGSFHSRATVMGGSATLDAATRLRDVIRERAASRLGCAPGEVALADGLARSPGGRSLAWSELTDTELAADGVFVSSRHTYSYGAHAAHVAVDARTGRVEVLDYVGVEDVGRMINPLLLRGQATGAIMQGLGGVFLEHLVYDAEGQLLTGSLADYLMPTASDFPNIRVVFTEEHRSPMNPLGAKGAGEGGIIPVGGVIANAVAAALAPLGVQIHELPLSPSRLWHLIEAAAARVQPRV